jgi:hypothetical protein
MDDIPDAIVNSSVRNLKLLITERTFFNKSTEYHIREKNSLPVMIRLEKGDIVTYLQENYPWLDTQIMNKIEVDCNGSFDYAKVCAEYYQQGGIKAELLQILSWKVEKYIRDIAESMHYNIEDVRYIIHLTSVFEPIDWKVDKEFFRKELPDRLFQIMESILYSSYYEFHDDIFLSNDGSIFTIKPDPLADFFLVRSLQQEKLKNFITRFSYLHPYNISINLLSVLPFDDQIFNIVYEILENIWDILNIRKGSKPEYIFAISLFMEIAYFYKPFFDLRKSNIDLWLSSFFEIYKKFQEHSLKIRIGSTLFRLGNLFGKIGYFEKSNEVLNALTHIYSRYRDDEFFSLIGLSLFYLCRSSASKNRLKIMDKYFDQLKNLYLDKPELVSLEFASALVIVHRTHTQYDPALTPRLHLKYLREINMLYKKYSDELIAERLAALLVNIISHSIENKNFIRQASFYPKELEKIYNRHRTEAIRKYLGACANKVIASCHSSGSNPIPKDLEHLKDVAIEFLRAQRIRRRELKIDEYVDMMKQLCEASIEHDIFELPYNNMIVFSVSETYLPVYSSLDQEMTITIQDVSIGFQVFLVVQLNVGDIAKEFVLDICPFRLKNELHYRNAVTALADRSLDPYSDNFNDVEIYLTGKTGAQILKNTRLTDEQKYFQLHKVKCMLASYKSKFQTITGALFGIQYLEKSRSPYCQYCRNKSYSDIVDELWTTRLVKL